MQKKSEAGKNRKTEIACGAAAAAQKGKKMDNKMEMNEFVTAVAKIIAEKLGKEVEEAVVTRNNGVKMHGLRFSSGEGTVSPVVYLNNYYSRHIEGESVDALADEIADVLEQSAAETPQDMMPLLEKARGNRDEAVKMVMPRLVNAEANKAALEKRPHVRIGDDLAVVYALQLSDNASIPLDCDNAGTFGLEEAGLHAAAMANLQDKGFEFKGITEILAEMGYPVPAAGGEELFYFLGNKSKMNGAVEAINPKAMEAVREKIGDEFVILPSSVHEVLLVPVSKDTSIEELRGIVKEVNGMSGCVSPEDKLSDSVYRYDYQAERLVAVA